MPNTIRAIEGWDSDESWKAVPTALPNPVSYSQQPGWNGAGKCIRLLTSAAYTLPYRMLSINPTLGTTWFIISVMVKITGGSNTNTIAALAWSNSMAASGISGGSPRMALGFSQTGLVSIRSNSTTDTPISGASVPVDQWFHLEYRHRYGNASTGNYEIYINGTLQWSGVGDNSGAANPFVLQMGGLGTSENVSYDDMVVATSDDASPALIGKCEVRDYVPTSTVTNGWTGSDGNSTDNHLLVDDGLAASADYVQATAGSGLYDLYGHAAAPAAPLGVLVKAAAAASALGTDDYSIVLRSGAQEAKKRLTLGQGTATWRTGDLLTTDPNTSTAWTKAGFDAATFGVKA